MAQEQLSVISVIIPFYNEEENIQPLHEQLSTTLKTLNRQYKIIFIDDGSTDNTLNTDFRKLFNRHN